MRKYKLAGAAVALTAAAVTAGFLSTGAGSAAPRPARQRAGNAATAAATGPIAMYLRVTGAPGESVATGYTNQIGLGEYSWGTDVNSSTSKAEFQPLAVKYTADRSVPKLEADVETGQHPASATLTEVDTSTGKPIRVIDLTNVIVESVFLSSEDPTSAEVKLMAEQISDTYYYTDASGTVTHSVRSCWNIATNTTC